MEQEEKEWEKAVNEGQTEDLSHTEDLSNT